jgi:hypothetical protein
LSNRLCGIPSRCFGRNSRGERPAKVGDAEQKNDEHRQEKRELH